MQVDELRERRRAASIRLYGLDAAAASPGTEAGPHQPVDLTGLVELHEIVELTRAVLRTDGAGINLLVEDEQVTAASTGPLPAPLTRDRSICSTVLRHHEGTDIIEIADLSALSDLAANPLVDGRDAALRFYAAAPLVGKHGLALGTLCAWSSTPGHLDAQQRGTLRQFGRAVVNLLDERRRTLVPVAGGALRPVRGGRPPAPLTPA